MRFIFQIRIIRFMTLSNQVKFDAKNEDNLLFYAIFNDSVNVLGIFTKAIEGIMGLIFYVSKRQLKIKHAIPMSTTFSTENTINLEY